MSTTSKQGEHYLMVRIEARLRTRSPLHCGDGADLHASAWPSRTSPGNQGHINTVCQGVGGPYIPASTLRGSLRARCPEPERLFGSARGAGEAGRLRVYDAFLSPPAQPLAEDGYYVAQRGTTVRNAVSLDAVTGTAAEGRLFAFEIVPETSTANVVIEGDRLTEHDLAQVLGLLQTWDGSAASAIGRGRSRGWGRVTLDGNPTVHVLTPKAMATWAAGAGDTPPPLTALSPLPVAAPAAPAKLRRLTLRITPLAPTLVNQPGRVKPRQPNSLEPALEFMRAADGTAIIPGSTLRGALSARVARILRTLVLAAGGSSLPADLDGAIQPMLSALFGTERQRSPLWIDEASATRLDQPEPFVQRPRKQNFNAIDRFTAGVAGGALYAVNAVDCAGFDARVSLEEDRLPAGDWWRAVLLYLARDLIEGDIGIGWGKSRGYGTVLGSILLDDGTLIGDFEALLSVVRTHFGPDAPKRWALALEKEIRARVQQAPGQEQEQEHTS